MAHYELAVVGSGSGNSLLTPEWDERAVAIIDGGTFGGTCLNSGCIPTKMLVYPAGLAAAPAQAKELGVELSLDGVNWDAMRERIFTRIDSISRAGRDFRAQEQGNVTLYEERVHLVGDRRLVTASGEIITTDRLVIAAGSRVRLPEIPGIGLTQVHTSDTIMRIPERPQRLLIIGGGYIAAEFAHIFGSMGTEVTVAVRSGTMLRELDATVAEAFTRQACAQWDVALNHTVEHLASNPDGSVTAELHGPNGTRMVEVDLVLAATGRIPNTDLLRAAEAGLDLHADGRISVDAQQRVLSQGLPLTQTWALGDISSAHQLKHVANHEARVVAHNLLNPHSPRFSDHRFIPAAVFTHPQIATVGMTEDQALADAQARGIEIVTAVQQYGSTAYGWAMEDTVGFVKLIAEKRGGRLLGGHIMGHAASMIIQPLIQAMSFGLDAHTMARGQYWIHPALTEVLENALLALKTDPERC